MTENYKIPTLLEDMGSITGIDAQTVYILQVYVPCGYSPEKVAELINYRTRIVCYCRNFVGLSAAYAERMADYVYINVASAIGHRLPEVRKQIREVLQAEYGKGGSDVKAFLKAIDACASGSKFALGYDSMWDVWNAMIDRKQWEYLHYTIHQINSKTEAGELEEFNLTRLSNLRKLDEFRGADVGALDRVFRPEYLKSLNPFTRPGDQK